MREINKKYEINAPIESVWDALTNEATINRWGARKAHMQPEKGFEFSLWNGDIWGKNIEVKKNKKLVQEWYGGDWKEPSIATFTLSSKKNKTIVELLHTNVPENEYDDQNRGWDDYYLGAIKELLENE